MKSQAWWLILLLLSLPLPLRSQQADCNPIQINGAGTIKAPSGAEGATRVRIAKLVQFRPETVSDLEFTLVGGNWSLGSEKFEQMKALTSDTDRQEIKTVWMRNDDEVLLVRPFLMPGEGRQKICSGTVVSGPPPSGGTPSQPGVAPAQPAQPAQKVIANFEACQPFLATLEDEIRLKLGSDHYIAIIFKPDGTECAKTKPRGTAGDLIYTALLDDGSSISGQPNVEFTKCEAPAITPNNPEGETLAGKTQALNLKLFKFPPQQCFGTSAEMKIKNKLTGNKDINATYTLSLYNRFRFTLQTGLLGSPQHNPNFGLRKDGNDSRIFNKGPVNNGPEYVATVVLYGLPHYFGVGRPTGPPSGERDAIKSYFGRDVLNETGFADRLGFVLGAGLNSPGDGVVAGLSFELGFGINLVGVYEYAKLKELVGVKEGDVFTGTVEQIPTRDVWSGRWVGGVSVDLRYFTRLIKRASS